MTMETPILEKRMDLSRLLQLRSMLAPQHLKIYEDSPNAVAGFVPG